MKKCFNCDCGFEPIHRDSESHMCRRCGDKEGHREDFVTQIDHDLLRAKLGEKLSAEVLSECRPEYPIPYY